MILFLELHGTVCDKVGEVEGVGAGTSADMALAYVGKPENIDICFLVK